MKLQPYPEYKDSGVPWLGEIPAHWDVMPLKHWVSINASVLCENTNPNFQFRYIDIAAVGTGRLIAQPRTEKFVDAPSRARRVIKTGDTLLSTVRTYLKAVYHFKNVQDNIVTSTGFAVLTPKTGTAPDYISYCVQSEPFVNQVCTNSVGVAYPAISESKLGRCLSWVPTIQEQTQIARFLDWKTAQIKKFIRNKRRLVELLKEQKQNIINLAVTRGLNPDVRFKPSGVEWIGDIPEHWETRRLRTLAAVRVSGVDKNRNEGEIPVILCNYVDVYKNDRITVTIDFMKATATLEEIRTFELKAGDVIITKDSESWEDIAVFTFVPDALSDIVCAYHLALIRPFPGEIEGEFLFRAFSSDPVADQFRVSTCGVTRFGLSLGAIKGTFFSVPPLEEQQKIIAYINEKSAGIDQTITHAQREIELISEYRTRLISDVVTGQVDVRGIEIPEIADEELSALDEGGGNADDMIDDEVETEVAE